MVVSDSIFRKAEIVIITCKTDCHAALFRCGYDFLSFRGITTNYGVTMQFYTQLPVSSCTILVEDSLFTDGVPSLLVSRLSFDFKTTNGTAVQAIIRNSTFAHNDIETPITDLKNAVVLFEDCILRITLTPQFKQLLPFKVATLSIITLLS